MTREDIWDIDAEETTRILNVNITGTLRGIKAVVADMKKNATGSIVKISSEAGLVAELEDRAALDAFSIDARHIDIAMSILEFRKDEDIAILDYTL